MTTQQEVADHAGVSISTVWRVLNEPDSVDRSTRTRVELALDELHYERRPSQTHRQRTKQSIGLIVPDLANPFFAMVIKGCESVARTHGYRLMISDSENSTEEESEHLEVAMESDTSGVVIVPADGVTPTIAQTASRGFPMVFLDRTIDELDVSSVTSDNYEGANQATKYLLRLGHVRILFVAGGPGKSSADQRLLGFRNAMEEAGLTVSERHIVSAGYDFENAHRVVKEALSDGVSFSAVFASADVMAFGAKRAIEEHGLRIPEDISLVGYDDIHLASSIGLTTVAQPALEMGRNAITTLIHFVERRLAKPTRLVLQPRLVIRETCRRINEDSNQRRT